MAFPLEVKEEPKQDLADPMKWYASKVENLDRKFLRAVEETLLRIQQHPFAAKKVYKQFRQTAVKRFPYVIIYEPGPKTIVIYSVFNRWQHQRKK